MMAAAEVSTIGIEGFAALGILVLTYFALTISWKVKTDHRLADMERQFKQHLSCEAKILRKLENIDDSLGKMGVELVSLKFYLSGKGVIPQPPDTP